jgi:hypothetical protein
VSSHAAALPATLPPYESELPYRNYTLAVRLGQPFFPKYFPDPGIWKSDSEQRASWPPAVNVHSRRAPEHFRLSRRQILLQGGN